MSTELYTIGHSTHAAEYFIGLLGHHGITAVCDVRSHPYSRYNPQYNRDVVKSDLEDCGIAYVFLGRELGARSKNPDCYADGKIQFDRLVHEALFQQGLERLKKGIGAYRVALMCAEKDPVTCHRTILVTRQLRREFTIKHVLEDGGIETNEAAETRLLNLLKIHPDLERNENQCIEQAYDLQGQKIAYTKETTKEKRAVHENNE